MCVCVCVCVSMIFLMQYSTPHLEVATNTPALAGTAQLALTALEVCQDSSTGDSVQVYLEERSEV